MVAASIRTIAPLTMAFPKIDKEGFSRKKLCKLLTTSFINLRSNLREKIPFAVSHADIAKSSFMPKKHANQREVKLQFQIQHIRAQKRFVVKLLRKKYDRVEARFKDGTDDLEKLLTAIVAIVKSKHADSVSQSRAIVAVDAHNHQVELVAIEISVHDIFPD